MARRLCSLLLAVLPACAAHTPSPPARPAAAPHTALADETRAEALVARIRSLPPIDDPHVADELLDAIARPDDVVRTAAFLALCRMTRPECLERLREHGLRHPEGV